MESSNFSRPTVLAWKKHYQLARELLAEGNTEKALVHAVLALVVKEVSR